MYNMKWNERMVEVLQRFLQVRAKWHKTLFIVVLSFRFPHKYVDLVPVDMSVQKETKATRRWRVTAILQVMSNETCAYGDSWKYTFSVPFISMDTDAVLVHTLAKGEGSNGCPCMH